MCVQVYSIILLSSLLFVFNVMGSPYHKDGHSNNNNGYFNQGTNSQPQGGLLGGSGYQEQPSAGQTHHGGNYNAAPQAGNYGQQGQGQHQPQGFAGQPNQNQFGTPNHGNHQGGYKTHGY